MESDLIINIGGLELLSSEYGELFIFQNPHWISVWLRTYGSLLKVEPIVFEFKEVRSQFHLILPLAIRNINPGIRVLTVLGGFHSDYVAGQMLGMPSSLVLDKCWKAIDSWALKNGIDLINIPRMPEKINQNKNPLVTDLLRRSELSDQIDLKSGWEVFFHTDMKKKLKADIRRQIKRLMQVGKLVFHEASSLPEALLLTDEMISQKQSRYREMGVQDQFIHQEAKNFYRELTRELWPSGIVHVSCLYLNEEIISTHWGVKYRNRFYYLMPAHDSVGWGNYSPGKIHLQFLVQSAAKMGCTIFDFTVGGEAYKSEWRNTQMQLFVYEKTLTFKGYFIKIGLIFWAIAKGIKNRNR